MKSGKVLIEWGPDGRLAIKSSLIVGDSEDRRLLIRVLLDAAKSVSDSSESLIVSSPSVVKILGG